MCYKDQIQQRNKAKLTEKFAEDNTPDFIRLYFINFARKSQASTLVYYRVIKDFLKWCIGKNYITKPFEKITTDDLNPLIPIQVQEYLAEREDTVSNATMFHNGSILKSFWEYLLDNDYVTKNIVKLKKLHREKTGENLTKKLPTTEQIQQMLESIRQAAKTKAKSKRAQKYKKETSEFLSKRNEYVVRVLIGSGIRESELAGLDLSNVYLYGSTEDPKPYIEVLGKGSYNSKTEQRRVVLTTDAAEAITDWLSIRFTMENISDINALFLNNRGARLNEDNIRGIFKQYGNGITPHMCRHYYATKLNDKYGSVAVQQQCGHVSINTTIGHYINSIAGLTEISLTI